MSVSHDPRTALVGDTLQPFQRTTDLHNWNRFAAVNGEFVGIHMDDDAGRARGWLSGAFGMGNLQWSYLHNLLRDWLGEEGRIAKVCCQFRAANTKGMTVTAHGVVTAIHDDEGGRTIELDVWTEDEHGNKVAPGSATVLITA